MVEDDRKVARFIQAGLEEEGYGVDVLYDGREAADQAQLVGRGAQFGARAGVKALTAKSATDAATNDQKARKIPSSTRW